MVNSGVEVKRGGGGGGGFGVLGAWYCFSFRIITVYDTSGSWTGVHKIN